MASGEASTQASGGGAVVQVANPLLVTAASIIVAILPTLDSTIANVALPRVQGELSASQEQMGWVLTSYMVAAAVMLPLTGWLATAYGKRRVLLVSIVMFTATSVLCGAAVSLPQIVVFRLLQGMSGAALVPLSQAVLFDINEPRNYGRAMALWAGAAQIGAIAGPVVGGWLTEHFSWRWVFYINLPIGVVAFLGMLAFNDGAPRRRSRFDVMGFATLSLAIIALQLLLDRGQLQDWFASAEICTYAIVAATALYVFVVHMFTADDPFLKVGLFQDANFVAANIFMFVVGIVMFSSLALLPPLLQNEFRYPVELTGLIVMPRGGGILIGMIFVGRILKLIGQRGGIALGFLIMALSLWQMAGFSPEMGAGPMVVSGFVQGLGIAMVFVPASSVAFSTLPANLRDEGTALFSLMRNIGSSLGIAMVFFLLSRNTQTVHASLSGMLRLPGSGAFGAALASHEPFAPSGLAAWDEVLNRQSTFIAYLDDFRLMMILSLATMPLVLLLRGSRASGTGGPVVLD